MITLNSQYQYIGRATNPSQRCHILLYAKTTGDPATGVHKVSVRMRLADAEGVYPNVNIWANTGFIKIADKEALSWDDSALPPQWWNFTSFTEDGVTYNQWFDLKECSAEINTEYYMAEISINALYQLISSADIPELGVYIHPPLEASFTVRLPEIEMPAEPEPEEPDEPKPEEPNQVLEGVRVYADNILVYDSRLEEYDLVGLTVTNGLNVGGTAEIILPLRHPAYNRFTSQRTIVTVYRDGVLRFRGRALYSTENFYGQRTVTCEGELCLLRDTINRPYIYEATPRSCFVTLINQHNAQTDPEKQFKVGRVTVTDPNDYIKLESESAETSMDTLEKLLDRCGGYITFTSKADGSRVINWLATLTNRSNQSIEFGENLLDFSSTGANTTELATGLIPYGAKDETTKKRLTIESVNGGKDYILADDAIELRGTIMTTATWDDVTDPAVLLKKAKAYLEERKVFITSLNLTALDLSYLDKDLDSFAVGDMIRVISEPHGVNELFQLSQLTEDLINPARSNITLGKDIQSLTGSDVAGDNRSKKEIETVKTNYDSDLVGVASLVESSVLDKAAVIYVPRDAIAALEEELAKTDETLLARIVAEENKRAEQDLLLRTSLNTEVNNRAGMISKANGVVNIGGGAPVKILGTASFDKEASFLNGSGIRIADKDGGSYYVLRVDNANSCVVGNDYCNLYLRGKDAVYLYKTGATVTSDRRQKNSIEALPEAYVAMLDKLAPVRFRYNGRGDKYHVGFVAQDVDAALTGAGLTREDFGGFVDVAGDGSELGLAYDEFIGLLLEKIRRLETRITAMEEKET